jgi:sulfhydrogenase subunit gamma (sulfur reductase)
MKEGDSYIPDEATVARTEELGADSTLLTIRFNDRKRQKAFTWNPGQFVMVGLPGYGEIPVGLASSPLDNGWFQVSVRGVGGVSNALRRLQKGDQVCVRGPFGNGFPLKKMEGKRVIVAGGGCGIPPLRSLVEYAIARKRKYKSVCLLYGSKTQGDLLFRPEFGRWKKAGIDLRITVDKLDKGWKGKLPISCGVGAVTKLLDGVKVDRAPKPGPSTRT